MTSDNNGEINVHIDFNPGNIKFIITNPLNNESIIDNIMVKPRLSDNHDIKMYYGANKYYKVKVLDDYGKTLKSERINIMINTKAYSVKTDGNGFAAIKLNKLKPGKYNVRVDYKGFKVSNKITVKPTLAAKDKSVKKSKSIKFKARLVNANGKALKGKKITFKIKGKTYKVKTNGK